MTIGELKLQLNVKEENDQNYMFIFVSVMYRWPYGPWVCLPPAPRWAVRLPLGACIDRCG
jgi:hypothetical protein